MAPFSPELLRLLCFIACRRRCQPLPRVSGTGQGIENSLMLKPGQNPYLCLLTGQVDFCTENARHAEQGCFCTANTTCATQTLQPQLQCFLGQTVASLGQRFAHPIQLRGILKFQACAVGCQVDLCLVNTRTRCQRCFNSPDTAGAGHTLDVQVKTDHALSSILDGHSLKLDVMSRSRALSMSFQRKPNGGLSVSVLSFRPTLSIWSLSMAATTQV